MKKKIIILLLLTVSNAFAQTEVGNLDNLNKNFKITESVEVTTLQRIVRHNVRVGWGARPALGSTWFPNTYAEKPYYGGPTYNSGVIFVGYTYRPWLVK